MVELIIFLYQFVCIVCKNRRIIITAGLTYYVCKIGKHLNQSFFFGTQFHTCWNYSRNGDTSFCSFTQDRLDTSVSILDKRSCITVEVDRFFRVERHVLACIHFQDEVLQSTQTDNTCDVVCLFLSQSVQFAQFTAGFLSCFYHSLHQVVGINNRTFTALHLTFRQFYHAVREVNQILTPFKSQLVEQNRKYLEVIILFISNDIDMLVEVIF